MKYVVRIMLALALALTVTMGRAGHAQAQAAKGAPWQAAITVLNVDAGPATINIDFYPGNGGAPISFQPTNKLNAGAGTSYSLSSISGISTGFKGSAVIYSDQRLVSTVVQFVVGNLGGRSVRPLSNGFGAADASPNYLIPTVLNNEFSTVTEFSIQNVETTNITATVNFYAVGASTPALVKEYPIKPNEAQLVDASTVGLAGGFNGSASVSAVKATDATAANVVATINEYNTVNGNASSVEGARQGGNTIYMPSALCALQTSTGPTTTSYAVQNVAPFDSGINASVSLRFYDLNGNLNRTIGPFELTPGSKKSVNGCTDAGLPAGFSGSAVVESVGADVVVVGKVGGAGLSTAFVGSRTGGQVLALPYVRWSPQAQFAAGTRQRTFIAIQNLNTTSVTVDVSYRDANGAEVAKKTYTVPGGGGKVNSNPKEAGAAPNDVFGEVNGTFGGGAIITSSASSSIVAVVRVVSGSGPTYTGEDYNAIPIQ